MGKTINDFWKRHGSPLNALQAEKIRSELKYLIIITQASGNVMK
ncbi:hypothetical protein HMP0721_2277 [Pseudoramibacter alactolyticus ATCC 23263]|uniref:Uncharacterized protein n=1 Tax=Pseudoramibacter alactolyticus ATCC 23263 TaxID=887929 RepID=E6MJU2_9FIRM|nr:hypothetical protein HMP0721_2277 [Pseudoramibacter alactolyticus ATCC 23263]